MADGFRAIAGRESGQELHYDRGSRVIENSVEEVKNQIFYCQSYQGGPKTG